MLRCYMAFDIVFKYQRFNFYFSVGTTLDYVIASKQYTQQGIPL